ncbi:MAG: nitrate/nitrite transporter NrtS [Chloroflexi bacterium]|nr:nitrate/nitrite transporter NrtS [Chloroflexota bacterium]
MPLIRRSLAASLVIGTIITLLNQGDLILTGQLSAALVWKIPLSYVVPFAVATWGALSNARR